MTTETSTKQAGNAPAPVLGPFRSGTQGTLASDGYSTSFTPGASTTELGNYTPSSNYLIRGIYIQVSATASGNEVSNVAFNNDMPLGIFSTVEFNDTGGNPVIGPFDSYTLAMVNKYGGYQTNGDPRNSAVYSATTGSGTSAGSFAEVLFVPIEAVTRTGMGSLMNTSSDSTYTLQLTGCTSAALYSTAPTTIPTVNVKCFLSGWWKGQNSNASPTPRLVGSTQYHVRGTYNSLDGAEQFQVKQGLGQAIRTVYLLNYDVSSGNRSSSDFPDPFQIIYKGTNLVNWSRNLWQDQMSRQWGFSNATFDAANGLDTRVFVYSFATDFTNKPGDELGSSYLLTAQGDMMQYVGSWNGNSKLFVVVNYMASITGNNASFVPGSQAS
jgi:hypothetical protein